MEKCDAEGPRGSKCLLPEGHEGFFHESRTRAWTLDWAKNDNRTTWRSD